ncbi:MAG: HNH endonuclease [Sideroxyarcus sp.]|nr:HNH endonuclease [Sideroxyarcus sp.]
MRSYSKPTFGTREKLTHRVLHYLHDRTSPKHPEWRNTTIEFFYELFNLMNSNPSLNLMFHRADGLRIYSGSTIVAFLHFYQKHFLIHATEDYVIWNAGDTLFETQHKGSFPRMWKATTPMEVVNFIAYLSKLPRQAVETSDRASRTIPAWVQEFVFERDGGRCVACRSTNNLCFDHVLPFSKGGSSEHPNNLQILCAKCNSEKTANFWPIKVLG